MRYRLPNLVTLGQTVWAQIGDAQKFGRRWGPSPLDAGHGRPIMNTLLRYLYSHAKFGHSGSDDTSVIDGDPPEKKTDPS